MEFELTDDIPPPAPGANRSGGRKRYPFAEMRVGQGFNLATAEDRQRAMNAAAIHCRTGIGAGKKFVSARHGSGFRLWRVA